MRQKLTPAFVLDAEAPQKGDRVVYWDTAMPGFGLMVTKTGARSFVFQYRNALHQSRRMTWAARMDGSKAGLTLDQAHREAKKVAGDVERGIDPLEQQREERRKTEEARRKAEAAATTTVKAILEDYLVQVLGMTRDEQGNATFDGTKRSAPEQLRTFEQHVYPQIGEEQIEHLKRSRITKMLDNIATNSGPVMADRTLAYLRAGLNWYASRTDDYVSPIVRGMARTKSKERAGTRVLTDDEIRDLWTALDTAAEGLPTCYPKYIRTLLLTALRRNEGSEGSWLEIERVRRDGFDGPVWTIPQARMKNKLDHAVPLTLAILTLIGEQPNDARKRPFLFSTTRGEKPFSGFSKAKKMVEEQIAEIRRKDGRPPMPPWGLHDLRRTAKTLMIRAGVRPDISERVLSHVIPGVEGIYDRWGYLPEKLDALTRLAALVVRIINPPVDNVASLDEHRAKTAAS
jgi:integrase